MPLSRTGLRVPLDEGRWKKPVFAIKPERPSFSPSSLISGTPAWGVLDYAVHTFIAFFVSTIELFWLIYEFCVLLPSLGGFHLVSLIGHLPSPCRVAMMVCRVSRPRGRGPLARPWLDKGNAQAKYNKRASPSRPHPRIPCA